MDSRNLRQLGSYLRSCLRENGKAFGTRLSRVQESSRWQDGQKVKENLMGDVLIAIHCNRRGENEEYCPVAIYNPLTFVDRDKLQRSHTIPTGNGRIGTIGKVGIIQALHRNDGNGRGNIFQVLVLSTEDPYTHAYVPWNATCFGRKRYVERVLHDLRGRCR